MRTLKWAAELAVSSDEERADLGVRELHALLRSAMLEPEQQSFIDAALTSVYGHVEDEIEAAEDEGMQVEVVVATDVDIEQTSTYAGSVGGAAADRGRRERQAWR